MTAVVNVNEPKTEVILRQPQPRLLARAAQDQLSQKNRPLARESVQLNLWAKERGSDQLNLQIRLKARARMGESQKGKKGDLEKGKPKKGSSKGSTDKGKSKDKHYSKGKGQK